MLCSDETMAEVRTADQMCVAHCLVGGGPHDCREAWVIRGKLTQGSDNQFSATAHETLKSGSSTTLTWHARRMNIPRAHTSALKGSVASPFSSSGGISVPRRA
jgi:hypothetical protein